jgi:hypothetical protein
MGATKPLEEKFHMSLALRLLQSFENGYKISLPDAVSMFVKARNPISLQTVNVLRRLGLMQLHCQIDKTMTMKKK